MISNQIIVFDLKVCFDHLDDFQNDHSSPDSKSRHVGDLGNILTPGGSEETVIDIKDSVASLHGQFSVVNRAIVVHAGEDDLGRGGNEESLKTGNAGCLYQQCLLNKFLEIPD